MATAIRLKYYGNREVLRLHGCKLNDCANDSPRKEPERDHVIHARVSVRIPHRRNRLRERGQRAFAALQSRTGRGRDDESASLTAHFSRDAVDGDGNVTLGISSLLSPLR